MSAVKAAVLPKMTMDEVKASAQRILDLRGRPPYTGETFQDPGMRGVGAPEISADEARVISEFVQFWLPFLVEKEKR